MIQRCLLSLVFVCIPALADHLEWRCTELRDNQYQEGKLELIQCGSHISYNNCRGGTIRAINGQESVSFSFRASGKIGDKLPKKIEYLQVEVGERLPSLNRATALVQGGSLDEDSISLFLESGTNRATICQFAYNNS